MPDDEFDEDEIELDENGDPIEPDEDEDSEDDEVEEDEEADLEDDTNAFSDMVKLPDGTFVSVSKIVAMRDNLREAKRVNKDLKTDFEKVGLLFRNDIAAEDREDATRGVLTNLGYNEDQINRYLSAVRTATEPTQEEPTDSSGGTDEEMTKEQDPRFDAVSSELESQRQEVHRMRVRELRVRLNGELDRVLETNQDFQKLLEKAQALRGDEGAKQARETLRGQLERGALEAMQSRRNAAGSFEDAWMSEEVAKAAVPVVSVFRTVIGDLDRLGRSSETDSGFDAAEILRSKPVPPPEWKPGVTMSDLESDIKSFAADTIKRDMATLPSQSVI